MMDSGLVRNMERTLSNKFEKLCISLAFITRIRIINTQCGQNAELLNVKRGDAP
jgi:hypothetical protein